MEDEPSEKLSLVFFRPRELKTKKSADRMRQVPLRIGSPVRDDPVPSLAAGGQSVDRTQTSSTPEPMTGKQPAVATSRTSASKKGKDKEPWQAVPVLPKGPQKKKTKASQPDQAQG
ncbi:hypothetical protein R1flu_006610 [Riccia fluitans]|uniref:Uncharacterized protein n=1 Tax=Riccia fluitans TaxID=41844 RepID=A0ABD1YWI2_9MARC